jgi:hypothetical protein
LKAKWLGLSPAIYEGGPETSDGGMMGGIIP